MGQTRKQEEEERKRWRNVVILEAEEEVSERSEAERALWKRAKLTRSFRSA